MDFPCVTCGKNIPQDFSDDESAVKVKCRECVKKEDDYCALKARCALLKMLLKLNIPKQEWTKQGVYKLAELNEEIRKILREFQGLHSKNFLEQWLKGCKHYPEIALENLVKWEQIDKIKVGDV